MVDERGLEFEQQVSSTLQSLNRKVRQGIKFGEVLGRDLGEDPGYIDVLAWRDNRLVVLLGCKRLQFAKTPSEIAKQLVKFRGVLDDGGKPDRLYKHLNRWTIAKENLAAPATFTGLSNRTIEAGLVSFNTVPMQFAIDKMSEKIWFGTALELQGF